MSERVNRHARVSVTALLGAIASVATISLPVAAAPPPGSPTGSRVEIIFLDAAGQPIRDAGAVPPARVSPERPTPRPSAPPPAAPRPAAPRAEAGAPAAPLRATTADTWGATRRRPILGDGSNASELVAAAQRVVGLRGRADRPIVSHVLASAAVPLALPEGGAPCEAALSALAAAGRQVVGARPADLTFGDVVFFSRRGDARLAFGVVEGVGSDGRIHVIGEGGDVVSRFVFTAERHTLRAVARP